MSTDSDNNANSPSPSMDLPEGMFRSGETPEGASLKIENVNQGGTLYEAIEYTEVDGWAIYEGDIILGRAETIRNDPQAMGLTIDGDTYRWPDGRVPYVIADESVRERVEAAIRHWEEKTPITFHVRTPADHDYVIFRGQGGCSSMIGRQGGEQVIFLGAGCTAGSAIHEIGHTLGLFHEQCRSDRDNFITVVEANINPSYRHNFAKHVTDASLAGPYDYRSIMHYPATAFSINGQATIIAKDGTPIGQRDGLSAGDIEAIKSIYPDLDWSPFEAAAGAGTEAVAGADAGTGGAETSDSDHG